MLCEDTKQVVFTVLGQNNIDLCLVVLIQLQYGNIIPSLCSGNVNGHSVTVLFEPCILVLLVILVFV